MEKNSELKKTTALLLLLDERMEEEEFVERILENGVAATCTRSKERVFECVEVGNSNKKIKDTFFATKKKAAQSPRSQTCTCYKNIHFFPVV